MTQLERDLIATRDRIARPENWMQGGCGHVPPGPFGPYAVCASVSAMLVVGHGAESARTGRYQAVMRALAATLSDDELVAAECKYRGAYDDCWQKMGPLEPHALVIGFNDRHQHAEVIAKLDRAIGTEQMRQRPRKPRILYDATEAVEELRRKALQAAAVVA